MLLKMRPTGLGHGVYKDVASTRPVPALPIYVPTRPWRTRNPALLKSCGAGRDREIRVRSELEAVEGVVGMEEA
jgi:hypothetical protein